MELAGVKAITIPEGNVTRILDSAGNVLWEAESGYRKRYVFTVTATDPNGTGSRELSITVQEAI